MSGFRNFVLLNVAYLLIVSSTTASNKENITFRKDPTLTEHLLKFLNNFDDNIIGFHLIVPRNDNSDDINDIKPSQLGKILEYITFLRNIVENDPDFNLKKKIKVRKRECDAQLGLKERSKISEIKSEPFGYKDVSRNIRSVASIIAPKKSESSTTEPGPFLQVDSKPINWFNAQDCVSNTISNKSQHKSVRDLKEYVGLKRCGSSVNAIENLTSTQVYLGRIPRSGVGDIVRRAGYGFIVRPDPLSQHLYLVVPGAEDEPIQVFPFILNLPKSRLDYIGTLTNSQLRGSESNNRLNYNSSDVPGGQSKSRVLRSSSTLLSTSPSGKTGNKSSKWFTKKREIWGNMPSNKHNLDTSNFYVSTYNFNGTFPKKTSKLMDLCHGNYPSYTDKDLTRNCNANVSIISHTSKQSKFKLPIVHNEVSYRSRFDRPTNVNDISLSNSNINIINGRYAETLPSVSTGSSGIEPHKWTSPKLSHAASWQNQLTPYLPLEANKGSKNIRTSSHSAAKSKTGNYYPYSSKSVGNYNINSETSLPFQSRPTFNGAMVKSEKESSSCEGYNMDTNKNSFYKRKVVQILSHAKNGNFTPMVKSKRDLPYRNISAFPDCNKKFLMRYVPNKQLNNGPIFNETLAKSVRFNRGNLKPLVLGFDNLNYNISCRNRSNKSKSNERIDRAAEKTAPPDDGRLNLFIAYPYELCMNSPNNAEKNKSLLTNFYGNNLTMPAILFSSKNNYSASNKTWKDKLIPNSKIFLSNTDLISNKSDKTNLLLQRYFLGIEKLLNSVTPVYYRINEIKKEGNNLLNDKSNNDEKTFFILNSNVSNLVDNAQSNFSEQFNGSPQHLPLNLSNIQAVKLLQRVSVPPVNLKTPFPLAATEKIINKLKPFNSFSETPSVELSDFTNGTTDSSVIEENLAAVTYQTCSLLDIESNSELSKRVFADDLRKCNSSNLLIKLTDPKQIDELSNLNFQTTESIESKVLLFLQNSSLSTVKYENFENVTECPIQPTMLKLSRNINDFVPLLPTRRNAYTVDFSCTTEFVTELFPQFSYSDLSYCKDGIDCKSNKHFDCNMDSNEIPTRNSHVVFDEHIDSTTGYCCKEHMEKVLEPANLHTYSDSFITVESELEEISESPEESDNYEFPNNSPVISVNIFPIIGGWGKPSLKTPSNLLSKKKNKHRDFSDMFSEMFVNRDKIIKNISHKKKRKNGKRRSGTVPPGNKSINNILKLKLENILKSPQIRAENKKNFFW